MKQKFYPLLVAALAIGLLITTSCKKQQNSVEPPIVTSSTMKLTSEEAMRLLLMSSNRERSADEILNAVAIDFPEVATKSTSFSITDSISAISYTKTSDPVVIYVVSADNNSNFALVTKDRVLPSVVGYFDGAYDKNNLNPGFQIMLDYTIEQLTYTRDSLNNLRNDGLSLEAARKVAQIQTKSVDDPDAPTEYIPQWDRFETLVEREWSESVVGIGPLLKTQWGQGYPYNSVIGHGYQAGCVATSTAQIMAYFKHPAVSPVDGQPYTWDLHRLSAYYSWNNDAENSVGRLFADLGRYQYLNMHYSDKGSSPIADFGDTDGCSNTPRTFERMGYHGGSHQAYSVSALIGGLRIGPVHICGYSHTTSGHTWVVDGYFESRHWKTLMIKFYYDNQLVHISYSEPQLGSETYRTHHNFGWNGQNDGFFGGTSKDAGYPQRMEIITGVCPK